MNAPAKTELPITAWLPTTVKEARQRGWHTLDVVLFSGDAYVDHPAFGPAVIGRILQAMGLKVAIVPQPNWRDDGRDFIKFGKPNLFFAVTAGVMDSMVNHYTARKRKRSTDAYSPGGKPGFRPDYALTVYSKMVKKFFPDVPLVIGGIEASLRRLTHYDYWSDSLKPSILVDSGADLLIYGMGEQPLTRVVNLLLKGVPFENLTTIPQTAILRPADFPLPKNKKWRIRRLHSHEICLKDKKAFAENFKYIEKESNKLKPDTVLIQAYGSSLVIVNPPFNTNTSAQLDYSFDLPYTRLPHPRYKKRGPIPAYEMIKHSITLHRGCFGGCSFCTISAHQGKFIASRSKASILKEARAVTQMADFKGYISDLGGPSANMYRMQGKDLSICEKCLRPSCIYPSVCFNLDTDHKPLLDIYQAVREIPGVKKAFVSSGIRYDLFLDQKDQNYFQQLLQHHVSGRLKVAPEHTSERVLRLMRKPSFRYFMKLKKMFDRWNKQFNLKLQLIPYFISGHPGSSLEDMAELAAITKELGFKLEQVQDFTPTPMTLATVIFYSGYHPYTLQPVPSPTSLTEKKEQNRFFFWYKKENREWIKKTLLKIGRKDLIQRLLG